MKSIEPEFWSERHKKIFDELPTYSIMLYLTVVVFLITWIIVSVILGE